MEALIKKLIKENIQVSVSGSELKIHTNKGTAVSLDLVEELKKNKKELIEFIIKNDVFSDIKESMFSAQKRPHKIPLSFSQERLWFADLLEGSLQFQKSVIINLKGTVDKDILNESFNEVINRHEIIRTVYLEDEGHFHQKPLGKDSWTLEYVEGISQLEIDKIIIEQTNIPFDLFKDHMLRACLFKISEEEFTLLLVLHRIAFDDTSVSIMVNELIECYVAKKEKQQPKLKELPLQYADYAIWQRNYFQNEVIDEGLKYWEVKLLDVQTLNLPLDFSRPVLQSHKSSVEFNIIDNDLKNALSKLAQKEGVSLFMLMATVLKFLLHKYSRQDDICIGTIGSNRDHEKVEGAIGLFMDYLPLRTFFDGDIAFSELLRQVKITILDAYSHSEIPLEKIVDRVVNKIELSTTPLFQVLFSMENIMLYEPITQMGDIALSVEDSNANDFVNFDLEIKIIDSAESIKVVANYCSDLFLSTTIKRMLEHYKQLLWSVVKDANRKISELTMITPAEEKKILKDFNTHRQYPKDKSIVDLFEEQVEKTPDKIALEFNDKQFTYKQLDALANKLAIYLRTEYGVKADDLIGVMMDKSEWAIISLLGILKSGAAYLPIDINYPTNRKSYIFEDTKLKVVIIHSDGKEVITRLEVENVKIVTIDTQLAGTGEVHTKKDGKSRPFIQPNDLAYVIYTSGSSGRPKGVMIEHVGIVNMILEQIRIFGIEQEDGVLQFASLSFDASILEIFIGLCSGAKLVLAENQIYNHVKQFISYLKEKEVTVVLFPPAYLHCLNLSELSFLRVIISGGEAANLDHAMYCSKNSHFFNAYGPTECTVCVTIYDATEAKSINRALPIGKPISNINIYILDDDLELQPVNVAGELCVSGVGLARGYLGNKELTEKKFIPHPFIEGERLYRTGDLAKWLPDGNIEFIGRKDEQIKIRGYRIELGEIEFVLNESGFVRQSIVTTKEDSEGNKFLVAYVVANENSEESDIYKYLRKRLPDFMVPSHIIFLEQFPLTSSGKIDVTALPDIYLEASIADNYVAPRNAIEEGLVQIWEEMLGLERVGVYDNFFEIGGHSLLATRLISKLNGDFSIRISIKEIFNRPTIAELSTYINESMSYEDKYRDLVRTESNTEIPLTEENQIKKSTQNKNQENILLVSDSEGLSEDDQYALITDTLKSSKVIQDKLLDNYTKINADMDDLIKWMKYKKEEI